MNATITIPAHQTAPLSPGFYWFELDTTRPVARAELLAALRAMGLSSIRFEHRDPVYIDGHVGGAYAATKADITAAAARAPVAVQTATAPSYAETKAATAAATVAPLGVAAAQPLGSTYAAEKAIQEAIRWQQSLPAPSGAPGIAPPPPLQKGIAVERPAAPAPAPGLGKGAATIDRPPPAVPPPPTREVAPPPEPEAIPERYEAEPEAYAPPERRFPYEAELQPEWRRVEDDVTVEARPPIPARRLPSVIAVTPKEFPVDLGTCTLLNPGSISPMYVCPSGSPGGARVAGVSPPPKPGPRRTVRFTATLTQPIDLSSGKEIVWRAVHRLAFDPASPLTDEPRGPRLRVQPFPLVHGATYDLRFLSRDKTARSKEAVCAVLEGMGFQPAEALLLARNLRVPGRPATTMSEWLAVGTWRGPNSIVTSDDPFYFAEARPST